MSDIFYMVLGVGIFAAIIGHAFVSPRFEMRNTPSPRETYPSSLIVISRRHVN